MALLTSSTKAREKEVIKAGLAAGTVDVLVSTQAALWVTAWGRLALVVVDEQHK